MTDSVLEQPETLRVLMVTARYFPFIGGTELHVHEVARRLAARGAAVTVLTTDPGGALPRAEAAEGVQIRRVRAWPAERDYYFAPGLYRTITGGEWDVVHVQGYHTLVAPLAMLAARRAGLPYVVTLHSGGHSSAGRNRLRGAQWALLRPLLADARRLVAVSPFEARFFEDQLRLPAEQFSVIPNGSNLPRITERVAVDPDLIVAVGRLERYKGHQHLIAALPAIIAGRPDAHLRILGGGPYEGELRALAARLGVADRIEIGTIPGSDREAMARLFASAGVAVLLSEYESQGLGITEALAVGCPAVVADGSALRDLARYPGVTAVAPEAGPEPIARAVLERMAGRRTSVQIHLPTWDDCAANLHALYRAVTRSTGDVHVPAGELLPVEGESR